MSSIQHRRKVVEQLRREAAVRRINVSTAVEDLKKYIEEHKNEDYILIGFHSQKANPFQNERTMIGYCYAVGHQLKNIRLRKHYLKFHVFAIEYGQKF
ncbi:Guanine nucleotide-binding protein subunit like protein [Argiope bruennichi]|uniref:Guanine nucleotide-binding protein subunit gamma n=1 Tax=Argiope bruennichi TaxID=94029 RepID=A0A8T0F2A7_ARGBR|nr:Guanine nucleotide-binding protein subunit like protein [Argiope bruennichi]